MVLLALFPFVLVLAKSINRSVVGVANLLIYSFVGSLCFIFVSYIVLVQTGSSIKHKVLSDANVHAVFES